MTNIRDMILVYSMYFDLCSRWKRTLTFLPVVIFAFSGLLIAVAPVCAQDWTQQDVPEEDDQVQDTNGGAWDFEFIASSADGTKLVAATGGLPSGSPIFTSKDSGVTWQVTTAPSIIWASVASSADGSKLVALGDDVTYSTAGIYTSADSGATWTERTSLNTEWTGVASSADGIKLVAVSYSSIYHSTDSGVTWQIAATPGATNGWNAVASSADGTRLVAVSNKLNYYNHYIYTSSDSGDTWQRASVPDEIWISVASSADGRKLIAAADFPDVIFTSTDYGASWQQQMGAPPEIWFTVASSSDGTRLVAGAGYFGQIYTSFDSGVTWLSTNNAPTLATHNAGWYAAAISADGTKLVALPFELSGIYTLQFPSSGHVFCICNSNGIPGATVQIGTNTMTTDDNGAYSLTNVLPGTYTVTVSATNYSTLTTNLTITVGQPVPDYYLTNTTLVIYPIIDSSITALAAADTISNSIWSATQAYSGYLADPLCVKIQFSSIAKGLGQSQTMQGSLYYSKYLADLMNSTNLSANDIAALATLHAPPNTGLLSNTVVMLTAANLDAIGEHSLANTVKGLSGGLNSQISLNFTILNTSRPGRNTNFYDLQSVATHEIDEVFGIGGNGSTLYLTNTYSGQTGPTDGVGPLDLYRYTAPGFRSFSLDSNATSYLSIDGGTNQLVYFNQYGKGSDFGDWGDGTNPADGMGNVPSQVQDAFGTPGATIDLGANELIGLDIIGYTLLKNSSIQELVYASASSSNKVTIIVQTVPGQTYQIQSTASLTLPIAWQNVDIPVVAPGLLSTFFDTNAIAKQQFYRVKAVPPLDVPPQIGASLGADYAQRAIAPAGVPIVTRVVIHGVFPRRQQP
jgi:Carboxypeptidase regulatory-like domain